MSEAQTKRKTQTDEVSTSSCKFRVYLNEQQHSVLSHYLYWIQKFRNEAVVFCEQRRTARGVWLHKHSKLIAGWKALDMEGEPTEADPKKISSKWLDTWLPENIAGSDVNAASKWLT